MSHASSQPAAKLCLTTAHPFRPLACAAAVVAAMEPMLQRLLALQVSDPVLMGNQARGLEAFQKIFGVRKDLAAPAVGRCDGRQLCSRPCGAEMSGFLCAPSSTPRLLLARYGGSPAHPARRVFDILVNNIPLDVPGQQPPPAKPPPGWKEAMQARQIAASESGWGCS